MHEGVVLAKGPLGRSNIYPCRNDLHEAVCFDRLRSYSTGSGFEEKLRQLTYGGVLKKTQIYLKFKPIRDNL